MRTNVAEPLQRLLEEESPDRPVRVHILLRSDLPSAQVQAALADIEGIAADAPVEVLPRNKTAVATLPLRDVDRIANMPAVFWINLDREAPLESLLDRPARRK